MAIVYPSAKRGHPPPKKPLRCETRTICRDTRNRAALRDRDGARFRPPEVPAKACSSREKSIWCREGPRNGREQSHVLIKLAPNSCPFAVFSSNQQAIAPRRPARDPAEYIGEVALIAQPGGEGDVRNFQIGAGQERLCAGNAHPPYIFCLNRTWRCHISGKPPRVGRFG